MMTDGPFASGYDSSVLVNGHVSWDLLTTDQQADLEANFPHQSGLDDDQTQAWLDSSYLQRTTVTSGSSEGLGLL